MFLWPSKGGVVKPFFTASLIYTYRENRAKFGQHKGQKNAFLGQKCFKTPIIEAKTRIWWFLAENVLKISKF